MKPAELIVYMISLPEDSRRREIMEKRFNPAYREFKHINGIRLSERKFLNDAYKQSQYNDKLTNAELGCALSHLHAIEQFLKSSARYAIIIEDDAIGSAASIDAISGIIANLPADAFLLCGGQEGLRGQPFNYGRHSHIDGVYLIPQVARKFYTRACCYCLTRPSAERLAHLQRRHLDLSDKWDEYFNNWKNFFFVKQISHPIDLADSNIERGRALNNAGSEIARIKRDGLTKISKRLFSKILLRTLSRALGLARIK